MKADEKMTTKNPEELKIIGRILEVLALALLIVNAVFLNMKDKDLGMQMSYF